MSVLLQTCTLCHPLHEAAQSFTHFSVLKYWAYCEIKQCRIKCGMQSRDRNCSYLHYIGFHSTQLHKCRCQAGSKYLHSYRFDCIQLMNRTKEDRCQYFFKHAHCAIPFMKLHSHSHTLVS